MVGEQEQPGDPSRGVTAVITWYHPDPSALDALAEAAAQCDHVLVVDNTPTGTTGPPAAADLPTNVRVLRPGENRGLAAALNLGVRELPAGTDRVLLLDQDSRLPAGMVARLSQHLQQARTGAAGPAPWDQQEGRYLDPRAARRPELAEVQVAITSGLLVARRALEAVGPFREDFFVDAVDLDFCLRLRRAGWRVVQDRTVLLAHRLGGTRWHRVLWFRVRASHHPDWRLYSGARNGTSLLREHLRGAPGWAVTQAALLAYWWLSVTAFEPPRRRRATLFLTGVADGWRGAPPRISIPPDDAAGGG